MDVKPTVAHHVGIVILMKNKNFNQNDEFMNRDCEKIAISSLSSMRIHFY